MRSHLNAAYIREGMGVAWKLPFRFEQESMAILIGQTR